MTFRDVRDALRALEHEGVRYLVIGSTGVALLHPGAFDLDAITDVDILISPAQLQLFATATSALGATVTSWGEPFEAARAAQSLTGRFYVRATFATIQIDATYESTTLVLDELFASATRVDEITVCPEVDLWFSKALRDPERALRFAREHGIEIPAAALERVYAALRNA